MPRPCGYGATNFLWCRTSSSDTWLVAVRRGRLTAHLIPTRHYPPGTHQITFDGSDLPSGIYLARLTAGEYSAVQKLVLLK